LAVGQHATGEQVVHQARLDLLVFGNHGFGFFDGGVDARKNCCQLLSMLAVSRYAENQALNARVF